MRNWFSRLTPNQKLAAAALALGAVAVFATPYPGSKVTLDAKELALAVGTGAGQVGAPELGAWIIAGRADYRLIDLRGEAAFAQYHIPTAVNIPVAVLTEAGLGRQEKLVLYSGDAVSAAQAWMILKARGHKGAAILQGGLDAWKDQVVFPVLADTPTPEERARDERRRSMSAFFGGQPRSAAAVAAGAGSGFPALSGPAVPALPNVVAPPSPAGRGQTAAPKKREGC